MDKKSTAENESKMLNILIKTEPIIFPQFPIYSMDKLKILDSRTIICLRCLEDPKTEFTQFSKKIIVKKVTTCSDRTAVRILILDSDRENGPDRAVVLQL